MLNFAVIGRNFVVDSFLESAALFDELNFAAVYSRNDATAREFAAKYGVDKTYTSLDALCKDSEIDFVYVASPNICHEQQAVTLLNAGKHVLCEKPAAPSLDGFEKMLSAAEKNDRVLMEAMMPAHLPSFELLRELISKIGTVRRARLEYCQYSSRYDKFKRGTVENAFRPELCNGSLMDIGIYCVSAAVMLFGEPESVTGHSIFLPHSIDGEGTAILCYPDKLVEAVYSKITDSRLPSQIQGEDGCLYIDSVPHPHEFTLKMRNGDVQVFSPPCEFPDMYYEIADFIAQIKGSTMPRFNEYTAAALRVCDKMREITGITFGQ